MMIRKAMRGDASEIACLMMMAMNKIVYKLLGHEDEVMAIDFLKGFIVSSNNQYSHENIWVYDKNGIIAGMINIYDGGDLHELRRPVLEYLGQDSENLLNIDDETAAGEFYIDTLAVSPEYRGQGIAQGILEFAIDKYVYQDNNILGLLVDVDNPKAHALYTRLGFISKGYKALLGERLEHLQFEIYK